MALLIDCLKPPGARDCMAPLAIFLVALLRDMPGTRTSGCDEWQMAGGPDMVSTQNKVRTRMHGCHTDGSTPSA